MLICINVNNKTNDKYEKFCWLEKIAIIKRQIRYRTATTVYPCFLPDLGEFDRSWSYRFADTNLLKI